MTKIYYNQADLRWANHAYPSSNYPQATVESAGCGPTCSAMIVSSTKEVIYPDQMCDISKENGYRAPNGTSDGLFEYTANRWGIPMKRVYSSYEAHQACKEGYFVVIAVGSGLWTTGGHYILAVGASNDKIEIYDPYLYNNKFNQLGREGKVELVGNSAWVQIDTFKENSNAQRFFAFKIDESFEPAPTPEIQPMVKYVNTNSQPLNIRSGPGSNYADIGDLPKGTQVLVYEEQNGWSRIGDGKWASNEYLTTSLTQQGWINTNMLNLNIRNAPNGTVIGSIAKDTAVTIYEESNGWCRIGDNKWISKDYVRYTAERAGTSTVGQTRKFKSTTYIYTNSSLTGNYYTYKSNTTVQILENTNATTDKIVVSVNGRIGYVSTSVYK